LLPLPPFFPLPTFPFLPFPGRDGFNDGRLVGLPEVLFDDPENVGETVGKPVKVGRGVFVGEKVNVGRIVPVDEGLGAEVPEEVVGVEITDGVADGASEANRRSPLK
jgi:hypothetical protein